MKARIPAAILAMLAMSAGATKDFPKLKRDAESLKKDIISARTCFPKWETKEISFCTGFKLSQAEIQRITQLNRDQCFDEIKEHGYSVADTAQPSTIPSNEWQDFQSSTQRALTFSDRSVVAFKANTDKVDCIHELIHVLQWTSKSANPLAPSVRLKKVVDFSARLMKEVEEITSLEKARKVEAAKAESVKLQPIITWVNDYAKISDGLDEVEAHYFVFKNCKEMGCSVDDLEYAVANLDRRKSELPVGVANEIEAVVTTLTKQKFAKVGKDLVPTWKSFGAGEEKLVRELAELEWRPLVKKITDRGAKILALDVKPSLVAYKFKDAIPASFFETLPKVGEKEMKLLANSKLLTGEAYGKFFCGQAAPLIIITQAASRGTLIHEYLHSLQNLNNETYCDAVSKQQEVADRFKNGLIKKDEYEKTVIGYQIINALAERDVYALMKKAGEAQADAFEKANNAEMFRKYDDLLQFKATQ